MLWSNSMFRLLFVDDEPFLLQALRRSLRPKRDEWEMEFSEGGKAALELMKQQSFDVLITDMRMPSISGLDLVREVVARGYDTVRILLTGQSEHESIVPCLGLVHRFLAKPCEPKQLVSVIERLLIARSHLECATVRAGLTNMEFLPMKQEICDEFQANLFSKNPDLERLGRLVGQDVGLTARVMRLLQSAAIAAPSKCLYPTTALEVIGVETLRLLVDNSVMFPASGSFKWKREYDALARNALVMGEKLRDEAIAAGNQEAEVSQAWLTGLFAEVGSLALAQLPPEDNPATHTETSHVTSYLLELWGAPVGVSEYFAVGETAINPS